MAHLIHPALSTEYGQVVRLKSLILDGPEGIYVLAPMLGVTCSFSKT